MVGISCFIDSGSSWKSIILVVLLNVRLFVSVLMVAVFSVVLMLPSMAETGELVAVSLTYVFLLLVSVVELSASAVFSEVTLLSVFT